MPRKLVRIVKSSIDMDEALSFLSDLTSGAHCLFSGVVRNNNDGKQVTRIVYHCYEEMALGEMEKLTDRMVEEFELNAACMIHRIGEIPIGDSSVIIAASSAHRDASFQAARFGIEKLKKDVPIWKEEFYSDGKRWVENR